MAAAGPNTSVAAQQAREALSRSDLGRELLAILDGSGAREQLTQQPKYISDLYLIAATRASYRLLDLPEATPEELTSLVRDSLAVAGRPGDEARYVLTDPARRETIRAFAGSPQLAAELEKVCASENSETRWLGQLLRGGETAADILRDKLATEQSLTEVTAATGALFKALAIDPTLEGLATKARRQLDREEILSPLRILIGTRSAVGEGGGDDNFVGRDQQLEQLYAYVGVLPPATLGDRFRRLGRKISDVFTNSRGPLVIYGVGGMGKSSLVAKFVMEHARIGEDQLLFAYLDFDRTTLARTNTAGLLVEIVRQVGLLSSAGSLDKTRETLSELLHELRSLQSRPDESLISDHARRFISSVGDTSSKVPFLLVLDSFERVQRQGAHAVRRSLALLQELGLFDGRWPHLRVVICSRVDAPDLRGNLNPIQLGPFDAESATRLAVRLFEARGIQPEEKLAKAVGGVSKGYPLAVRVLTDSLAEAEPAEQRSFMADSGNAKADAAKIATIFYKRFAQRISIPGGIASLKAAICLRTITIPALESALQVLKTGDVVATSDRGAQADPFSAETIFEALSADPTLWAEKSPDYLRWGPELRRLLLECVRAESPDLLRGVSARILQELQGAVDDNEHDAARVYYGLLAGKGVESVDAPSRREAVRSLLSEASGDFPQGSPEQSYLDLVSSGRPPTLTDVEVLPPILALSLIGAIEPDFIEVGGRYFDSRVVALSKRLPKISRWDWGSPSEQLAVFRLLVKIGAWREAKRILRTSEFLDAESTTALPFLAARTYLPESTCRKFFEINRFDGRSLVLPFCVHALVAARIVDSNAFERWDTNQVFGTPRVDQMFETPRVGEDKRIVFLAGTFGVKAADWALRSLGEAGHDRDEFFSGVSAHQCRLLRSLDILPEAVDIKHFGDGSPLEASSFDAVEDHNLTDAVYASLGRLEDIPRPVARPMTGAFCALQDPFWAEPLGYALARLYEGRADEWIGDACRIIARLESEGIVGRNLASRCVSPSVLGDHLLFLQVVDQASALPVFIEAAREHVENKSPSLIFLIDRALENRWLSFGLGANHLFRIGGFFERVQSFFEWFNILEGETNRARTEFLFLAADYWRWDKTKAQIAGPEKIHDFIRS